MYPLKFKKIYKEKIWGGIKFKELLNMNLPSNKLYGESWEISAHLNGMSVVDNGQFTGMTLKNLISTHGNKLLGSKVMDKFDGEFPLLVKYLDINDKLSVQVHPDDNYAGRVEGGFGKFESWYVMDASEDARLILGIKDGISRKDFVRRVKSKKVNNLFKEVNVKKGDFLDVKPGLVHASLEGSIVICEIQQNSDTTYRIWDFDREEKGFKRELHLDKAAEVIDFDLSPVISSELSRKKIRFENGYLEQLTRTKYYQIDRVVLEGGMYKQEIRSVFTILSILDGDGSIKYKDNLLTVSKGETYLIPADMEISIKGNLELLSSYI